MSKPEQHLSTTAPCPRWQKPARLPFQTPWAAFAVLLSLLLLQFNILPAFFPNTPLETIPAWIIFLSVTRSPLSALMWTLVTSAFLETHTSAPRGFYTLTLTALAGMTLILRDHISWKYIFPWSMVLLCGYLWFLGAESFTLSVLNTPYESLHFSSLTSWLSRLLSGILFGLLLARYTISRGGDALEYR